MEKLSFEAAIDLMKENILNDVGIFKSGGCFDIIIDGNGHSPIGTVSPKVFSMLSKKGYLKKAQCTNCNHHHFFYGFIPIPTSLQDLLPIETTDSILDNKEFYLVPRGKTRIFININRDGEATIVKNKSKAQVYTKKYIWDIYLQSFLCGIPYWYNNHGLNRVVYRCKGEISIKTEYDEQYYFKDCELLSTDSKDRYSLFTCIDQDYKKVLTYNLGENVDEKVKEIISSGKIFNWSVGIKCSNGFFSFSSWVELDGKKLIKNSILY